jgi:hypothetical protein
VSLEVEDSARKSQERWKVIGGEDLTLENGAIAAPPHFGPSLGTLDASRCTEEYDHVQSTIARGDAARISTAKTVWRIGQRALLPLAATNTRAPSRARVAGLAVPVNCDPTSAASYKSTS